MSPRPWSRRSATPSRCWCELNLESAAMSQVLPADRGLRRVIGDGETLADGEVDGLGPEELVALYRNMVLLRTYDERSVVFHRQGRIGTYAIFWNHEAMQAGAVFALEQRDWIFPAYRESAIGLLRGIPVSTVLSWWRGHPAGWWNPKDYNVAWILLTFLGVFGVHRFYLGKIVTGVIYLLTGGLLLLGVIYDYWTLNDQIDEIHYRAA